MSHSGVFLCPSCQAVIQSDRGTENGLTCTECGHEFFKRTAMPPPVRSKNETKKSESVVRNVMSKRNPVTVEEAMTEVPAHEKPLVLRTEAPPMIKMEEEPDEVSGEMPEDKDEVILPDGSRRVRRRKKKLKKERHKALLIFLFVWMTIIGAVFYLFRSGEKDDENVVDEQSNGESILAARDRLFISDHFKEIYHRFKFFLGAIEEGKRLQQIDQSSQFSSQFIRYYRSETFPKLEGEIGYLARNVIEIKSEPNPILALETVWNDEKGNLLETTHVHDGENWKLDWEAFAPYSTSPWTLFVSNSGRSEGTFRLYLRKMKSLDDSEKIFVKFYPPFSYGQKWDRSILAMEESPGVEILTRSELGQKFIDLWQEFEKGNHPLNSIFPQRDPEGFMRVTVDLAWGVDEKGYDVLQLREIHGAAWFGQRIMEEQKAEAAENEGEENEEEESEGADKPVKDNTEEILKDE